MGAGNTVIVWCWGKVRGVCRGEVLKVDSTQDFRGVAADHNQRCHFHPLRVGI